MGRSSVDHKESSHNEGSHGSERGEPTMGFHYYRRMCRDRGILFEDPEFSLGVKFSSHGRHKHLGHSAITWMRPFEICTRPKFMSSSTSRFDVEQGELGGCSLMCGVSCLTMTPALLERVVPSEQNFSQNLYCGIFRFRFWHFGDWIEVIVDDRLPTTNKGRPLYLRSADPSEFWPALLEKAYAKFCGGYSSINGYKTSQVLQDLTGGIIQSFRIAEYEAHVMFQTINSSITRSTLLAASILTQDSRVPMRLRNGLVTQHSYSITGLARVRTTNAGEIPLIRLHNPLGKGEWNGPWSDRSWEWDSLPERDQELLSVRVRNDGEFWMSFEDFLLHFTTVDLLHVGPDDWMLESTLHSRRPWRAVLARRRWRTGYNAGGGLQHKDTMSVNPQFRVHISQNCGKKCHLVISVMQEYISGFQANEQSLKALQLLPAGFAVYEVPANTLRLNSQFLATHQPLDCASPTATREVVLFFSLPPGDFAIIPFTAQPNCEAKFLLRILTDEISSIWEVNDDNLILKDLSFTCNGDVSAVQSSLPLLQKITCKMPAEVDVAVLHKILRACWRPLHLLCEKPSLELCRSLVMLRDPTISGKISKKELPGLLWTLQYWKAVFLKFDSGSRNKTSSFQFRKLLWEAGLSVSNKVLECLVLRFTKDSILTAEAFLLALVKLYLAHERFVTMEKKMKENALTLEEMILLTVYS